MCEPVRTRMFVWVQVKVCVYVCAREGYTHVCVGVRVRIELLACESFRV